jgi:transcriptional regulator with XRE-family HTH domain
MHSSGSPVVRRWRLAAELRRLRERADRTLTVEQVAAAVGWSRSKISRYELGRTGLKPVDVEKLLDFYGIADPERSQLLNLAYDATKKGWWEGYADVIPEEYLTLIGLEAGASSEVEWQIEAIPGLLQTEDYARQIHLGYQQAVPIPPSVVERRVQVRMMRQEVLTRDLPLEYSAVLDEAILIRRVGDSSMMHGQLLRLAEVSDLPNVTLRIRPLSGERSLVAGSFNIFSFAPRSGSSEPILHDVLFSEHMRSEFYVEGDVETYTHHLVFRHLADESLSPTESREFILQAAERMRAV